MFRHVFIAFAIIAATSAVPAELERGGRIVGGISASIASRPFMASLRNFYNFHFCGGSIISNRWVLSAAHCVITNSDTSVLVVVGTARLNAGGTFYTSSKVIYHSDYSASDLRNDIAMIKTSTNITFNANVAPISLPTTATGEIGAIVSGWGLTSTNGNPSNQLLALYVTTKTNAFCSMYISMTANAMCTLPQVNAGICFGDSGSPLTANSEVIGVSSFIVGACAAGYPDGFTRVYSFIPWITNNFLLY